jgi:hypothetical protein
VAGGEVMESEGSRDNNIGGGDMGDRCWEARGGSEKEDMTGRRKV